MTQPVPRSVVAAFYSALAVRDMPTLASYLDDDVVWTISGPVDILPFCGRRVGKSIVMTMLDSDIPALLTRRRFYPNAMLVDGDRAAVLGRLTAIKREGGRSISYQIAQFIRFRDEKVIEYSSIIDSYDAVEQVLGHSLSVHDGPAAESNLIAV
jgi:ketosteroid isomerase-like protein